MPHCFAALISVAAIMPEGAGSGKRAGLWVMRCD
jgi:hypothetical protein